ADPVAAPPASYDQRGSFLLRGRPRWAPGRGARWRWRRHAHVRSGKDSFLCLLPCLLGPLPLLCLPGDLHDRRNNIGIRGAAAEIAAHTLADLLVVEGDVVGVQISAYHAWPTRLGLAQHPHCRAELSRGTVAALKCVMRDERLLERMQVFAIGRQPL